MSKPDFKTVVKQEEDRLRLLHPTPADVPGCVSVFDDYLGCSGTKILCIYGVSRVQSQSSCEQKFQEFKFCLSLKTMHPEEQREAWIRRRAEWWANRRLTKSSEDVWDMREQPLENFPKRITEDLMRESQVQT
ncbi:hypothetical protein CVT25_003016 [Psilocybe cyanescens]|uniref:Uncharacterized protein n=1 Tax=Psilocybe cyanescens TaxID=93625 RepID=A0A409WN64_PSICY|nr:hypothetical protein CVT25_003016 [Psilocybe cyanescens]